MPTKRVPIVLVNAAQAEEVDYVVCVSAEAHMPFKDNLLGTCNKCGRLIQFRPYMPTRPPKICTHCAVKLPSA